MKRIVAIVALLTTLSAGSAFATPSSARGCPSKNRCGLYGLENVRWPTQHGQVTIHYQLAPITPWATITPDKVVLAAEAAAHTWELADPKVHFVLDRTTTDLDQLGDGINNISFVATLDPTVIAETNYRTRGRRLLEVDTLLNEAKPWGWTQCASNCVDDSGTGVRFMDLQAVLTQQFGLWLSLRLIDDQRGTQLTMYSIVNYGERHQDVLGLGDIRGVRAAYP
ncbi:MAG: hypothetical protein ACYDCC_07000 [Actinomycetota bacterium]